MKFKFHVLEGLKSEYWHLVFNSEDKGLLSKNLKKFAFFADDELNKQGVLKTAYVTDHNNSLQVLSCGLGKLKKISHQDAVELGAKIAAELNRQKVTKAILHFDYEDQEMLLNILEGIKLRNYAFDSLFQEKKEKHKLHLSEIVVNSDSKKLEKDFKVREIIAESTHFTRDLVSLPGNHLTPKKFTEICLDLEKYGLEVEVLDKKQLMKHKMNALLGVAQGSTEPPFVVIMKWLGNNQSKDMISFIGKGVTFDSGGLNLKPSGRSISLMKYDMGGAAVVTGLLKSLAMRKAKTNVVGVIGLTENMLSGSAQRPGDVVTSMSGQTIEIDNTDAEGRLVLGDIMWYAQEKFKPKVMIDLATLTGAIVMALGSHSAGLFSNNDKLVQNLCKAGENTNEHLWRLPLNDYYDSLINSDIADIKNVGRDGAGSITAAQFLLRFVQKNCAWAHIDIAGVNWLDADYKLSPKGATGYGVRLLNDFLMKNYE
jgi:leucyl aminopeptidase